MLPLKLSQMLSSGNEIRDIIGNEHQWNHLQLLLNNGKWTISNGFEQCLLPFHSSIHFSGLSIFFLQTKWDWNYICFFFCFLKNIKQQLMSRYKNGIVSRLQLAYSFLITFTIIILRLAIEMRAQVCQFAFVFVCRKLASAEASKETEHKCHKNGYFQFHFT